MSNLFCHLFLSFILSFMISLVISLVKEFMMAGNYVARQSGLRSGPVFSGKCRGSTKFCSQNHFVKICHSWKILVTKSVFMEFMSGATRTLHFH